MIKTRYRALLIAVIIVIGCGPSNAPPDDPDAPPPVVFDGAVDAPPPSPDAQLADFGEPCTTHSDCGVGGVCVDSGGGGGVCSRPCTDDCPFGWTCREVQLGDEMVDVCIPLFTQHCSRCSSDSECPGGACIQLDGEGRCAATCTTSGDCLTAYGCAPDPAGTHVGNYCQPVTGSCDCGPGLEGLTRTCSSTNPIGTCWGVETCSVATGWSACSASAAVAESCDGVDNDCDFVIDDGVGGGDPCTIDNAFGSCAGLTTCMGVSGFTCAGPTPMADACNFLDDDCDGAVDESFATLGTLCSAGVGACLSYGVFNCTMDTTGTVCSATAGTPSAETCDGVDEDCDGATDETFAALGSGCSAGTGICSRLGTTICTADTSGTECSATPGPPDPTDPCNYLDDDCDGNVDDGFRNPGTGFYDQDTTCGSCEIDCTTLYAAPDGYGTCVVSGTPQCVLACDAGFFNLNGQTLDGCEFLLDTDAIHVSGDDPGASNAAGCGLGPVGTGFLNFPCLTIAQGLARATTTGRSKVLVADSTYNEAVTLVNGKNLLGGYRSDTWERHLATTSTAIQGISSTGNHDRTVIATGITSPTLFEGFIVYGAFNAKAAGNSYAMYVSGSNASLVITSNIIYAGRGGPGGGGAVGTNGATGLNGIGRDSDPTGYDAKVASGSGLCNVSNNRSYANGAAMSCGGASVSGGNGGGNRCSPVTTLTEYSGIDGFNGQPPGSGGAAGDAGDDGYFGMFMGFVVCYVPAQPMFGEDGIEGASAANATGVAGCSAAAGSVAFGHWSAGAPSAGLAAPNGAGGGGGGGGGGGSTNAGSTPTPPKDRLGGHAGGGAAGGCGGAGGGAASGGGGVFAIFISGGTAPTITNNVITRGDGGTGGNGGNGGTGGLGGFGGAGGDIGAVPVCGGKGGRGGDGGAGGHGSGGGGGCGGSSFAIYTSGIGSPAYCAGASNNTISGGSVGPAGAGGASGGTAGGAGLPGTLAACSFN